MLYVYSQPAHVPQYHICRRLSAHLMELIGATNSTYGEKAELAANFIKSNLYDGNVIRSSITLQGCSATTGALTSDSGLFIEGLSIYANLTQSQEWTSL